MATTTNQRRTPTADRPPKPSVKTTYLILHCTAEGKEWWAVGKVRATSAGTAIRQYLGTPVVALEGAKYVAVPESSWKPLEFVIHRTETVALKPVVPALILINPPEADATADSGPSSEVAKPETAGFQPAPEGLTCQHPDCLAPATILVRAKAYCLEHDPDGIPF